jgi:hypothetical protein|tara:strand:+ start:797 stop:988 length:192 start_codon:yes stop_codon:yes gene_type:complete
VDVSLGARVDLGVDIGSKVVGVGVRPVLVDLLVELSAFLLRLFLSRVGGDGAGLVGFFDRFMM